MCKQIIMERATVVLVFLITVEFGLCIFEFEGTIVDNLNVNL